MSNTVRFASIFATLLSLTAHAHAQRPNVILMMTDDQGYGDLACHGNPLIQTPHLDRLHAESVRLTNFHVDPTCSPTRGALMSGKYSHRSKVWHTIAGGNHLRASEVTMAEVFKASGYRTGMFGKWHLGSNYPYRPMDRGFDEWLGQGDGGTGTTDDYFTNDRVNDHYWHNGERVYREGYAPDVFFDAAMGFLRQDDAPFFIYLNTYMPHTPHTLPDSEWAEKYEAEVGKPTAYFFAGIERIDHNLGRLREMLQQTGKAANTVLIFMTDNGGTAGVKLFNAGMRGKKGQVYDGGHRVPFFVRWPTGGLMHGADVGDLNAHFDVLPSLIDLCGLTPPREVDFDGRSFARLLFQPDLELPERTLFVETQRNYRPVKWEATVGMTRRWRLVDNKELYDIEEDPGQKTNVIQQFPEAANRIRKEHEIYWERVTPGDREVVRFVVGHPSDPETYLQCSDWYLQSVPWNHVQVARGERQAGAWHVAVAEEGTYRFEVRRWPREADTPITGLPRLGKQVDAWDSGGAKPTLIYAGTNAPFKALPVAFIRLSVGSFEKTTTVTDEVKVVFEVPLEEENYTIEAELLDRDYDLLAGGYYVYCSRK